MTMHNARTHCQRPYPLSTPVLHCRHPYSIAVTRTPLPTLIQLPKIHHLKHFSTVSQCEITCIPNLHTLLIRPRPLLHQSLTALISLPLSCMLRLLYLLPNNLEVAFGQSRFLLRSLQLGVAFLKLLHDFLMMLI
jgi:hypothetical protein